MKERDELLNRLDLREATLVHYDIRETNVRARTALNRFLFGRVDIKVVNGGRKRYRYPGLVPDAAEWVGQSVLLLDPDLADRVIAKLEELRAKRSVRTVYVPA